MTLPKRGPHLGVAAAALVLLLQLQLQLLVSGAEQPAASSSTSTSQESGGQRPVAEALAEPQSTTKTSAAAAAATRRARFVVPKLFDFELFKRTFRKRYRSLMEELVRRKYMLARAFRAFISAMKYKFRRLSYHLAVNHMSDLSPAELELMRNRALADQAAQLFVGQQQRQQQQYQHQTNVTSQAPRPQVDQIDPSRAEASLEELEVLLEEGAEGSSGNPLGRQLAAEMLAATAPGNATARRRQVSLEALVNTGGGARLDAETRAKLEAGPAVGNNPDYEPPELASFGLRDENLEQIPYVALYPVAPKPQQQQPGQGQGSLEDMLKGLFQDQDQDHGQGGQQPVDEDGDTQMADAQQQQDQQQLDQVFVDHRRSRCLLLPRDQGLCGSCYAFALVALAEWLHCIRSGHLVPFSEQYVVDCGRSTGGRGCAGGNVFELGNFVQNYGMELRQSYPYLGREEQCPYDADTEPKRMGFIRMELGAASVVPVESFEVYLEYGPIFVAVCTRGDFVEYGAGVHDSPAECAGQPPDHAMVLVGHGREDGRDYWLIRNSHSVGWGEQGHYKLAKGSECLRTAGVMFGTPNGAQFSEVRPRRNQRNDANVVRARYTQRLHDEVA